MTAPWTHQEAPGKPGFTKDGRLAGAMGDQSYTSVATHPAIKPYVALAAFFLIPVSPLTSHTWYTATVTVTGNQDMQTETWSFTTA